MLEIILAIAANFSTAYFAAAILFVAGHLSRATKVADKCDYFNFLRDFRNCSHHFGLPSRSRGKKVEGLSASNHSRSPRIKHLSSIRALPANSLIGSRLLSPGAEGRLGSRQHFDAGNGMNLIPVSVIIVHHPTTRDAYVRADGR